MFFILSEKGESVVGRTNIMLVINHIYWLIKGLVLVGSR